MRSRGLRRRSRPRSYGQLSRSATPTTSWCSLVCSQSRFGRRSAALRFSGSNNGRWTRGYPADLPDVTVGEANAVVDIAEQIVANSGRCIAGKRLDLTWRIVHRGPHDPEAVADVTGAQTMAVEAFIALESCSATLPTLRTSIHDY